MVSNFSGIPFRYRAVHSAVRSSESNAPFKQRGTTIVGWRCLLHCSSNWQSKSLVYIYSTCAKSDLLFAIAIFGTRRQTVHNIGVNWFYLDITYLDKVGEDLRDRQLSHTSKIRFLTLFPIWSSDRLTSQRSVADVRIITLAHGQLNRFLKHSVQRSRHEWPFLSHIVSLSEVRRPSVSRICLPVFVTRSSCHFHFFGYFGPPNFLAL